MFQSVLMFLRRHVAAIVVAFLVLGGTSFAVGGTSTVKSKTYYACVTAEHNTLNLTSKTAVCPRGQRKISFSAKGERGARGPVGAVGATGPAGATGSQGSQGPAGERGPSVFGSPGVQGEKGDTGPKGDTGATGPAGPAGPKGDAGAAGPTGAKGDTGATGPQGATGPAGPTGQAGPIGPVGAIGPAGPTGPAGPSGATFERVVGDQIFSSIPSVGAVTFSCFGGGGGNYGLQFTSTPPGAATTSVWKDDSIAGLAYQTTSGIAVITYLNPGAGTRHVVLRASNSTRSGTWDIFIEGSAANGCVASIQRTS